MEGFDFWGYTIAPYFLFYPILKKNLVSYIQILSNKQNK